jgi:branched-chain amino acid transport system ATP-binding protein
MAAIQGNGPVPVTGPEGPVLELDHISAGYGATRVLRDVSLSVRRGSITALLGANGAGKTTLMRVAAGILRPRDGRVVLRDTDVTGQPPHLRARAGLCLIPEGRGIFRSLSVAQNLRLQVPRGHGQVSLDRAYEAFPVLGRRASQRAGSLSGGEQQMLALARAFLSEPAVVLIDEISMGLAPIITAEIYASIAAIAEAGTALLIVEQYVSQVLELADAAVVLSRGVVTFRGPRADLTGDALAASYLGGRETTPEGSDT